MRIITVNTEDHLSEMLPIIERQPNAWMFIRVNISPLHDQILEKEGISKGSLAKVHKMSMQLAEKLNKFGLSECGGDIIIFEDGDVLALVQKKAGIMSEIEQKLREEFTKSGMIHLLVIEEMGQKLSQLITIAAQKKETAEEHKAKHRAIEIEEKLLGWTTPDPAMTRAIFEKRRTRPACGVLIVEDDALTRGLIAAAVKGDHDVYQAKDAESGIMAYIDHAPDIVFLDIHLPRIDGHEILKRLMQLDPKAYVVMLSADSSPDNVVSTRSHGAMGFICKPFSKEKIHEYIRKYPSQRPEVSTRALCWEWLKAKP